MSDLDNEKIEATRLLKNINEKELDELIKSTEGSIEETCNFLKYPVVAIVQEKSADEMFEELGYIEHFKSDYSETYREDSTHQLGRSFVFRYLGKRVNVPATLEMQELKAINKKCKELGWL